LSCSIATTDSGVFWGLVDNQSGTPVSTALHHPEFHVSRSVFFFRSLSPALLLTRATGGPSTRLNVLISASINGCSADLLGRMYVVCREMSKHSLVLKSVGCKSKAEATRTTCHKTCIKQSGGLENICRHWGIGTGDESACKDIVNCVCNQSRVHMLMVTPLVFAKIGESMPCFYADKEGSILSDDELTTKFPYRSSQCPAKWRVICLIHSCSDAGWTPD